MTVEAAKADVMGLLVTEADKPDEAEWAEVGRSDLKRPEET
jgi:hypothetical protein